MKKWRRGVCIFCMMGMLAACGSPEDEIQLVEQEDIGDVALVDAPDEVEKTGESGKIYTEAPEDTGATGETEASGGSDAGENAGSEPEEFAAGTPAVVDTEAVKQEYKDGELLLMTALYDRVNVSIEGNEAAAGLIMEWFARSEEAFWESAEDTAEWAKESKDMIAETSAYEQASGYAVIRNDGRVLSFSSNSGGYEGGAHGYYMEYGANFDAVTGQFLEIEDITEDEAAFQEICVQEMLRQCEDLRAEGILFDESMLLSVGGLQQILEAKMEGGEWYFTEDGIRFISNIYEIAPYAAGKITFDIPYEMVNETLKAEYRG